MKNLIKRIFCSKDYKPVILYEYTQGETSFVHIVYSCEVVYD
jgi:hypothetical protein